MWVEDLLLTFPAQFVTFLLGLLYIRVAMMMVYVASTSIMTLIVYLLYAKWFVFKVFVDHAEHASQILCMVKKFLNWECFIRHSLHLWPSSAWD